MIFKSTLPIVEFPFKINHNEQILSIGSCFTEHIGNQLKNSFFDIIQNPQRGDSAGCRSGAGNARARTPAPPAGRPAHLAAGRCRGPVAARWRMAAPRGH